MSLPVRLAATAFAAAIVCAACDKEKELLEQDLSLAESHLAELDRAAAKRSDIAALERDVDRRLPDGPRGALTASIARALPGVEIDGAIAEDKSGYVSTDPVEVTLPIELDRVAALFDTVKSLGRVWSLDSVKKDGDTLRVRLHAFTFSGSMPRPEITVSPFENTLFSVERDRLRMRIRRVLAEIEKKSAGSDRGETERYWKAELKASLLADLSARMEKIEDDASLVLGALKEANVVPLEWTIGIRMGRRLCALTFAGKDDKNRFRAVAASRPGVAIDAAEKELVLKSGRVCTLAVK